MQITGDVHCFTVLEVAQEDWDEYVEARERLRKCLMKNIDPVWEFVHSLPEPTVTWQGCKIQRKGG